MASEDPPDLPPPGALLEQHGFRVRLRRDAWWDCLLDDGERRFLGHGESAAAALADALRCMIPSERARHWFLQGLAARSGDAVHGSPAPGESAIPVGELVANEVDVPLGHQDAQAPWDERPSLGWEVIDSWTSTPPAQDLDPATRSPVSAAPEVPQAGERDAAAESPPPAARRPPYTEEEVLRCTAELAELAAIIRQSREDLAELAPPLIRISTLAWIAEARAAEERFPVRKEVEEAVHRVARELQTIASDYWPGMVTALQRTCVPVEAGVLLGLSPTDPGVEDWGAVAGSAHHALEQMAETPGLDEDGWADRGALSPAPLKADGLFTEVWARLEKLSGPLDTGKADHSNLPVWPPAEAYVAELVDLARKARWLRGRTRTPARWGILMGRLRCLGDRLPTLGAVLDPAFRPVHSWAAELGQDPEAKRRRRLRKQVLVERARCSGPWERDVMLEWLLRAFDVLDTPEIAPLVSEDAALVSSLSAADMPDRRRRSRLTRLRTLLSEEPDLQRAASIRAEAEEAAQHPEEGEEGAEEERDDPLLERVRAVTRGRRILFVGNRDDPGLREVLAQALEPAELDWCDAKVRKVASAAERIRAGRHDLVLSATGFLSHKTYFTIHEACKQAGVDHVRAYKGRLTSCLRAIARDLGLAASA